MLKKALNIVLLTGIAVSGIGIWLMFLSPAIGIDLAESWLRDTGSTEPDLYYLVLRTYIAVFLAIGTIFLSVGLTTTMYCFYKSRLLAVEQIRSF